MSTQERLPKASLLTLASILVTNIGNGMHTLAVGKLLYDRTGSAAAFGYVVIAEYVINFFVQLIAGAIVDRNQPKRVIVITDLIRGAFILLTCLMLASSSRDYGWILASIVVINLGKPFFRSATFSVGPSLTSGKGLLKYNAYYDALQQGGQLIGLMLVGFLMTRFSALTPFALNGLSYFLAAILVGVARIPPAEQKTDLCRIRAVDLWQDWKEMFDLVRRTPSFGLHLLLASTDIVAVNLIEVLVIPMTHDWYHADNHWLSIFNGAFAIGAIAGATIVTSIIARLGERSAPVVGLIGQAVCFGILPWIRNPFFAAFTIVILGVFNTLSFTCFMSTLQERSRGPIKGRVIAARYLVTGILALVLIPAVTRLQIHSTALAFQAAGWILAGFGAFTLALMLPRLFGSQLLKTNPNRQSEAV